MTGYDHALAFLRALHPAPGPQRLVQLIAMRPKSAPISLWYYDERSDAIDRALQLTAQGYNLFAGVNPRATMAGGERENVACVTALPIDIDSDKTRIPLASVVAGLTKCGLPPGLAVRSGHGGHLYLLLDRPYALDEAEAVGRRVCLAFFSDAVWNASRIMRLPGTVNWKDTPSLCTVLATNPENRCSLADITRRLDEAGAPTCQEDTSPSSDALPAAPTSVGALLDALPPHVFEVIRAGRPPDWWRKSRSELDWVVVLALVKAGATDEQISEIYETMPIRFIKAGEAGSGYLAQTVKRARQEAIRAVHDENPDLALLDDGNYYFDGRLIRYDVGAYTRAVEEMIKEDVAEEARASLTPQPPFDKIRLN